MTQKWIELIIVILGAGLLTGGLYLAARFSGALKSELELSIDLAEKCVRLCGLNASDGKSALLKRTLERNLTRVSRYMSLYGERHAGVSVSSELEEAKAALESADAVDDVYYGIAGEAFVRLLDSLKSLL